MLFSRDLFPWEVGLHHITPITGRQPTTTTVQNMAIKRIYQKYAVLWKAPVARVGREYNNAVTLFGQVKNKGAFL